MKYKFVDSLNKNEEVERLESINEYVKELDKHWKREHTGIKVISVITKQEIWIKG